MAFSCWQKRDLPHYGGKILISVSTMGEMTEIFNKENNNVHQIFIANTQGDYGLSEQTFLAHFLIK